jgi:hypothetical protein
MSKFLPRVYYTDGSTFELLGNSYADIDRNKLQYFELYDKDTGESKVKIKFDSNQRLIWRKRVFQTVGQDGKEIHIVGKQETIDGKNYQGFLWLFEDGTIEVGEKFKEGHPFFDNIILLDEEK